ncbi:unnamed protein product [Kuraishia capsulata CBS 1993]|uniref:Uncharacterized protein n=1 Tax=Kuraishia capsulata CBS 1993 TaxID=1382522 RepID=W6MPJ2_9ASCO|nr:uncharacterized protein KUCA_T00003009001 [Kuraishia capsulata CBS 1993]CDK27032.1 unnamed protein product [Kuraishia capsulata CBS 1993]
MIPSVHVIPQKQVVGIRWIPTYFEDLQKIVELPMNITDNSHGSLYVHDIRLLDQHFLQLETQLVYHCLRHQLALIQPFEALVQIQRTLYLS